MSHEPASESRFRVLRVGARRDAPERQRLRRGAYLLPSMFTMASMFCG